jgi:diguanylate cyclase (GGDEF)-like protein
VEQDRPLSAGYVPDSDTRVRRLIQAGQLAAANALFDEILAGGNPPTNIDQAVRAGVLVNRAVLAWRLGRLPLALELAAEGWTDLGSGRQEGVASAFTLGLLGYLLEGIGNRRAALETLRISVQLARNGGDKAILAHCLQRLGGTLNFRAIEASADEGRAAFEEARAVLAEGLGLHAEPAVYRALLGAYARSLAGLGELSAATEAARQVLKLGTTAEDRWAIAVGEWVLAEVSRARGELTQARTMAARAVTNADRINDTSLILRFSQDLAEICAALDDPVGEAAALRRTVSAARTAADTLREGLGQAMEQRRLAAAAQRLAMAAQEAAARDPLTGLVNRLGLERTAPELIGTAQRNGGTVWLVLVDIDWFKGVNDDAGHAAGDAALREIAQLLRNECRSDDLVARWAGDEFVVLLGARTGDAGPAVAERIRAAVAEHSWALVLGGARPPTVSIGVAAGPGSFDELFAAADVVLYQAKRQGRNRVAVFRQLDELGELAKD